MNFSGKTALITGASVGIGRAVALKLAENGAKLVLLDVDCPKLAALREELKGYTDDVLTFDCDVSDEKKVYETVEQAQKQFGKIDILVNNAALWRHFDSFDNTSTDVWRKFLAINVMGAVYLTKAVLPGMLERAYGKIVNVASVAGVYGNASMVPYSASKGALISMTRALAKEVADKGICVNCVSPGSVSPSDNPDVNFSKPSQLAFMGRTGTDMENANLIAFLVSDEASYISGQNIQIDGCRKQL